MKTILGGLVLGVILAAPSMAADLRPRPMPVKAAPVPAVTLHSWTGCYIGGHIGYAWGRKNDVSQNGDPVPVYNHDIDGFIAGGQVGCNLWQGDRFVFGIEGQAAWADIDGDAGVSATFSSANLRTEADIIGSIAARFGYAFGATGQTLVFVKGGAAFIHERHINRLTEFSAVLIGETDKYLRWGWMVGGGVEQALGGGWSVKAEYNYSDFGNKTRSLCFPTDCLDLSMQQHVHLVKVGLNYRFTGFGGPVVARY
jgi:outer membrane immunogenic protein